MQFSTAVLGFLVAVTGSLAAPLDSAVLTPTTTAAAAFSFGGDGTYFATGLGSCGTTNKASDYIVAISHLRMDQTKVPNPNNNVQCGKKIKVQHIVDKTHPSPPVITVTVKDTCMGCALNDLDFTTSAYAALGCTVKEGRCPITWQFI